MAISTLETLLSQKKINPDEIIKSKIRVERLGGEVEFSFKRLGYARYKALRRLCTERRRGAENFDAEKYRISVILECMTDPDFQKVEFLESVGVHNGEIGITKVFLPGEIVAIADTILIESGFNDDPFRVGIRDDEDASEEQE